MGCGAQCQPGTLPAHQALSPPTAPSQAAVLQWLSRVCSLLAQRCLRWQGAAPAAGLARLPQSGKVCIFFSCSALNRTPAALEKAWLKEDGAPSLLFTNLFYQDGSLQSSSLMASCSALRVAYLGSPVAWATAELAAGFANHQTLPPGSTEHLVLICAPKSL